MNKKRKYLSIIFAVIIIGIGSYLATFYIQNIISEGERHSYLDKIITREVLDSVKVGLERYKLQNNHYPKCNGKYFLDSIKTLVSIPDVYIYADILAEDGKLIPINKKVKIDYKNNPHTYLGIGNKDLTIIYKYEDNSYILYSVGENLIDEKGKGDDVLY